MYILGFTQMNKYLSIQFIQDCNFIHLVDFEHMNTSMWLGPFLYSKFINVYVLLSCF
jgi:hypothetical protein